ncbi:reverse transcriptase domain-containing protein [Tanacetum coccineum]
MATRPTGSLPSNTQTNPKPSSGSNDKAYHPPPARTKHVNVVCTRSGTTYDPPVNPNDKVIIIYDDSDDKAEEKHEEENPTPSAPKQTEPIPMKAYKPRIPYPQRLRKEKIEEKYGKFINMIKKVRINVPLIDVLVDLVILEMEEDSKVPFILGRPFLYSADAIIRVKGKELNLGVGNERITFMINKAM